MQDGVHDTGRFWVLRLEPSGLVGHQVLSSSGTFGLQAGDAFGVGIEGGLGDVDSDGLNDLAVGANRVDDPVFNGGEVFILFLNANDTVRGHVRLFGESGATFQFGYKLGGGLATFPSSAVGSAARLAVGSTGNKSILVQHIGQDGLIAGSTSVFGFGDVLPVARCANADGFGRSMSNIGDSNGDGHEDLAVGARRDSVQQT